MGGDIPGIVDVKYQKGKACHALNETALKTQKETKRKTTQDRYKQEPNRPLMIQEVRTRRTNMRLSLAKCSKWSAQ